MPRRTWFPLDTPEARADNGRRFAGPSPFSKPASILAIPYALSRESCAGKLSSFRGMERAKVRRRSGYGFSDMETTKIMKSELRGGLATAGRLAGLILTGLIFTGLIFAGLGAQVASAQTFGFPAATGFTASNVCANSATPPPACQVLTVGSPSQPQVITGGILQLNSANLNQHGAAWY